MVIKMVCLLAFPLVLVLSIIVESKSVHFSTVLTRNEPSTNESNKDRTNKASVLFENCSDTAHNSTFLLKTIHRIKESQPKDLLLFWSILPHSMPIHNQYGTVNLAFRLWSEALPLTFQYTSPDKADILVQFAKGERRSVVTYRNEKPVIVLRYSHNAFRPKDRVSISHALTHSLGHLFGLQHNDIEESIMYSVHTHKNTLFLGSYVEKEAREILGECQVDFNFVVDTVKDNKIKTRFYSDKVQWRYNNYEQSSVFGGLQIETVYPHMPKPLDTILYNYVQKNRSEVIDVYGFQGETIFKLNVHDMSPTRNFSFKDFDCSDKLTGVKEVLFMPCCSQIYLFNGSHFWEYEYEAFVNFKCPLRIVTFAELFMANYVDDLSAGFDHIYFSYYYRTLFFFKKDELYKADKIYWVESKEKYSLNLVHTGKWYKTFPDVCHSDSLNGLRINID